KGTAKNAVGDLAAYKDKMVGKTIQPGQWVTSEDLSCNAGISIPEGYQAMAIKISADTAAGGFILPGSRVNVVATIREQNQKTKVQLILQDQLVLAVDQSTNRPDGSNQAIATVNTALLAVKPKEGSGLLPDKALSPADLDGLKDKVVKVAVFKNSALSAGHFEGDLALASAPAPKKEENKHVLIIQNGTKEPTMTVFKDGQAVE